MPRRDLETPQSDFREHSREDLPDRHPQCFARTVSRHFLSSPIEQINVSAEIGSHQSGTQTVDNAITERLQECNLARRFFQFGACSSPTLRKEIRKKRHGTEAKNTQADDVLQRGKIRPDIRRGWNIAEIAEIHVSEMDHRAGGSRHERSAPLEQNTRHHDLQEVQRHKVTVHAACPVHGPRDEQQINRNLGVGLCNVGLVESEEREPAG